MKIGSVAEAHAAKGEIERIVRAWCDWRDAEENAPAAMRAKSAPAAHPKKSAKRKSSKTATRPRA